MLLENSNGIYMMQSMNRLVVFGNLTLEEAMFLMAIASITALFGSPLCGVIDTHFGTKKSALFICLLSLVCTILQIPGNRIAILIGMILFGIVMGGSSNVVVSLSSDAFPRDSSARAFSIIQPVMHLITMGVNECYLLIAGHARSYFPVYIIYICLLSVCMDLFGKFYSARKMCSIDEDLKEKSGYYSA